MPNNINKMLGNYKKIAYLDYSSSPISLFDNTRLPLNLSFEPKELIITVINNNDVNHYSTYQLSVISPNPFNKKDLNEIHYIRDGNTAYRRFSIKNFSKNELVWAEDYSNGVYYLAIASIIAIG